MVRFDEDEVPGNPGARETPEQEARRIALDALSRPIDLDPPGAEGEAAQAIGDAARASGGMPPPTRAGDVGLSPEDTMPPRRVVQIGEQQPITGRPEDSIVQRGDGAGAVMSPAALMHRRSHETADTSPPVTATTPATMTDKGGSGPSESALDRELRAAREQTARRVIGNTFGSAIELIGSAATGVPVRPGRSIEAGPGEDQARIMREHRLAAAQKEREGRETQLATSRAAREATLEDRDFALRERMAGIAERRASTPTQPRELDAARAAQIRESIDAQRRRMDAASPESAAARAQFTATMDTLPASMRSRLGEAFPQDRLAGMSAAELDAPMRRIAAFRERGTAGASTGGGGQATATRAALIRAYRERTGASEEEATAAVGALGSQRAASALTTDALARGRAEARAQTEGEEILPGVRAGVDLSPGEARGLRDGFASMRTSLENMRAVDGIARRYGAGGVISPEARAEMRPRLVTLRAMVAQMGNTGVINPTEVPTINAALPNPTDAEQMTVGDFNAQLTAWRSQLEASVRSGLVARGVDEDGVRAAMTMLHGRRAAPRAGAAGSTATAEGVRVRHPDGRTGTIPRERLDAARARGFEVVDGP